MASAATLAGASGFGFLLIAAPLLLIDGFDAISVVLICLGLTGVTRCWVALRFRTSVDRGRAALVAASVPGLFAGSLLVRAVDVNLLRAVIGCSVIAVVVGLLATRSRRSCPPGVLRCLAAGAGGGFLGAVAALNGVVPELLLTQSRMATRQLFATLALYTFASAAIGVATLTTNRVPAAAIEYAAMWTPVGAASNAVGVDAGLRLSPERIRQLALLVSLLAGVGVVAMAPR